jgi:anti-anti-sigma factor
LTVQRQPTVAQHPRVIALSGELDAGDPGFADQLLYQIDGSDRVVVDLLNVSFIDSSVVRALVLGWRATTDSDGWLRVVYTHHLIRRVIDMCGLADVLPQYPSVEAARRGVISQPPHSEAVDYGEGDP